MLERILGPEAARALEIRSTMLGLVGALEAAPVQSEAERAAQIAAATRRALGLE